MELPCGKPITGQMPTLVWGVEVEVEAGAEAEAEAGGAEEEEERISLASGMQ